MSHQSVSLPLHAERLILRDFVESDWKAILAASGSEEVQYMHERPYTEEGDRLTIQVPWTISLRPAPALLRGRDRERRLTSDLSGMRGPSILCLVKAGRMSYHGKRLDA